MLSYGNMSMLKSYQNCCRYEVDQEVQDVHTFWFYKSMDGILILENYDSSDRNEYCNVGFHIEWDNNSSLIEII